MLSRNKILIYLGIPAELGLLLLLGGLWAATPVSQASPAAGYYGADMHNYIWAPAWGPAAPISEMTPPWEGMKIWPPDQKATQQLPLMAPEEQAELTDSQRAELTTITRLQNDGIGFLTAETLREKMLSSSWHGIVVDVGAKSAYMGEHILGAINIPENQISSLAPVVLPDRQTPIVTYCGSTQCSASIGAAKQLKALGYGEVYDFWGGLKDWVALGLPTRGSEVAAR